MWQKEDDEDISWRKKEANDKPNNGPHPDYEANLHVARNFINNVKNNLNPLMSVRIVGSQWLENSILMISLNAGRYVAYGNWAHPLCLHQSKHSFAKSLEIVFNNYVRKAQKFTQPPSTGEVPHAQGF